MVLLVFQVHFQYTAKIDFLLNIFISFSNTNDFFNQDTFS